MTKLNVKEVRRIRRLRDVLDQTTLALMHRVSQPTISQVQLARTWKGVSQC